MDEYIFIVNPVAGKSKAKALFPQFEEIIKNKGITYKVYHTDAPNHGTLLAKENAKSGTKIVAVGGDGTVNEVLSGLIGSDADFGIIPLGTGNDIAYSFGITLKNAIDVLTNGKLFLTDVATVNDKPFLGVASCGLDSEVNKTANNMSKRFRFKNVYVIALFVTLIKFKPYHLKINFPDSSIEGDYMLVAVGHGNMYGGGMLVTPKAKRNDGLLDVCLLNKISKLLLIRIFPLIFSGAHINHPKVDYYQVPFLDIEGEGLIFADGNELTKLPTKYGFSEKKINVIVPLNYDN
jgi:diacylglycerol kinase (ATP)